MKILDCSCGHTPSVESNPGSFTQWDIFCFQCKRHLSCHPSKQNAIRAWNIQINKELGKELPKAG